MSDANDRIDVDAYLERIGYSGRREPTLETLRGLHLAHATAIPFENLDILLGRPILLDLASLQAKLVRARRGGYCFEHNSLFAAVLEALGFRVTRLGARVRMGRPPTEPLPDTHMLLAVDAQGAPWLADVGFGGDGLPLPIPFEPGPAIEEMRRTYRLVVEPAPTGGAIDSPSPHVLQTLRAGEWFALYAFTLEQRSDVDYEMANWFTSTHPRSPFVQGVVAQRLFPDGWLTLHGLELTRSYTDGRSETTMVGADELLSVLAERFGLEFPRGTRFP